MRYMAQIYNNILQLIGRTPLVEAENLEKELRLQARILVKLEYLNPTGSVKDRAAKSMIEDAENRGILKEGAVIIEPTSGNTGIGLAAIAAVKGYRMILTMPDTMSVERRNIPVSYTHLKSFWSIRKISWIQKTCFPFRDICMTGV